jgi:formamidopyrimidine-DNA glycosylase
MPEVIEVRKYADFLNLKLRNKNIKDIKILKGRYKTHGPFELFKELLDKCPLKVKEVKTKGKFLYMVLENDYFIFSTLGLHGGWTWLKEAKNNVDISKEFILNNILTSNKRSIFICMSKPKSFKQIILKLSN